MDSGAIAAANVHDLLFVGAASNGKTISRLSHGFHVRARKYGNMTADQIAKTAGAYDVTALQKGTAWVMQLVAFRPIGTARRRTPPIR